MAKGGGVLGLQDLQLHPAPGIFGKALELGQGLQGRLEDLLTAVGLAQEGNGDGAGLAQQDTQDRPFLGIEVGESVKENIFTLRIVRGFQVFAELGHLIPGVQAGAAEPGLVGAEEKAQIPELGAGGAFDGLGGAVEGLRRHLIAAQLVKEVQELLQKGGLLGGTAVDRQLRGHFCQGLLKGQQLAAGVQSDVRTAAGDGEDPVRQAAKAQNFRVAAGGGAADAAEVHLRQVGGVLRHQQDLAAGIPQVRDAAKDGL